MRGLALLLAILPTAQLVACAGPAPEEGPQVLATTSILADMASRVAGDRLDVASIAPAGAHVEQYAPKPDDARRVAGARLIFVNGLDLDQWVGPLLRNARTGTPAVTLTEGLETIDGNPHLWFDPALARRYVERIREALSALDTEGSEGYASRAKTYDAQLVRLDKELRSKIALLSPERRKLVTSHDAFPYFAKAYGFEIVGFAQPEPGKEPSAGELADLVDRIRAARVPAIFSETGVSPRLAQTLAREAGVRTVVADLPTDSVLEPPADSYVGVMRVLVDKIVTALR